MLRCVLVVAILLLTRSALAQDFCYFPPGQLKSGTGAGVSDMTVYAPDIRFPIEAAPAYLNSQVHNPGGSVPGDQCSESNYSGCWRDTFCESRSKVRKTFNCPRRQVHQGVDIRAGNSTTCKTVSKQPMQQHAAQPVVSVEDGMVSYIGSYLVAIRGKGRVYHYLHMNMKKLLVQKGENVKKGQRIGYVSKYFDGTPTTIHLHFEIKQNIAGRGVTWVSPYLSLVRAYERLVGKPGVMK